MIRKNRIKKIPLLFNFLLICSVLFLRNFHSGVPLKTRTERCLREGWDNLIKILPTSNRFKRILNENFYVIYILIFLLH